MFIFNGINSKNLGIIVTSSDHLDIKCEEYEIVEVPGRTGCLIVKNGGQINRDINIKGVVDAHGSSISNKLIGIKNAFRTNGIYKTITFPDDNLSFYAVLKENIKVTPISTYLAEIDIKLSAYTEE